MILNATIYVYAKLIYFISLRLWNLVANVEMKNRGPEILFTDKEFQDSLLNTITVKPYLTICMRNMLNLGEVANML